MKKHLLALPTTVVALAVIGLLINVSTTMIYSQLSMYMKNVLHASASQAATLDGIVESVSHITRIASGVISDVFQQRKVLLTIGYSLAALAKPLYIFASSIMLVFWAQALDRLGNGVIASPRDALVGDVTEKPKRGASYGFLKSMKTAGSMLGAFFAIVVMVLTADDFQTVFFIATIPAIVAMILLIIRVKEPKIHHGPGEKKRFKLTRENLRQFSGRYWKIIVLASFFELAHFSETLLSWRANDVGLSQSFVATVMVAMNMGQFLVAYPLGMLSDKFNRPLFLMVGFAFMILSNILMGAGSSVYTVMLGVFFWGAQMSTTQSIFLSMISTEVSKDLRGTAFGIFYFTSGICYLAASGLAGVLWDAFGSHMTFIVSGGIAAASIVWAAVSLRGVK